jgi:hypothetical protein
MNTPQQEQFEIWGILELMGRQRIAGKITERVIAGSGFLEVSVPETKSNPKFTRFISPGSLYAINPTDEQTAKIYAENLQVKPIDAWDISAFMKKVEERRLELAASPKEEAEEEDQDEIDARFK